MNFHYTWQQVLAGEKTTTRRVITPGDEALHNQQGEITAALHKGRAKWKVGSTYAVQPGRREKGIARIRLTHITQQKLGQITEAEARAEGYATREEFIAAWTAIHDHFDPAQTVWVLGFDLAETQN